MSIIALGCYTEGAQGASQNPGRGITLLDLDIERLVLVDGPVFKCESPSYLLWHPNGEVLYACHEDASGAVSALQVVGDDVLTIEMFEVSRVESGGADPCHLAFVNVHGADGLRPTHLVVSNYTGGSFAVFALTAEGAIGERTALVEHRGFSVVAARQSESHVHQSVFEWFEPKVSEGVALLHVADLGLDLIRSYRIGVDGSAEFHDETSLPPGAGPRQTLLRAPGFPPSHETLIEPQPELAPHVDEAPESDGPNAEPNELVLGELNSHLYLTSNGQPLAAIRTTNSVGENLPAHLASVGSSIVVSNRGANTLAFIHLDDTRLTLAAELPVGEWPRHFEVLPGTDQSHILVSNQLGNSMSVIRVSHVPGEFERAELVAEYTAESPACIAARPGQL